MANQILLAISWYNISCWSISKESIHKIQRLVRNSNFHILLGVCGLRDNGAFSSYDVLQDGRVGMIPLEDECLVEATLKLIRFLATVV